MEVIKVQELYDVVMDLARKHRSGGYASDELFSRQLKATELALLKYFYKQYESRHEIVEHLLPFVVREDLTTTTDGAWEIPDNFAYRLALEGVYLEHPDKCTDPYLKKCFPCQYMRTNRVAVVKSSHVIFPSIEKKRFYHHFANQKILFEPTSTYYFNPVYIRYPEFGVLAQTMADVDGEDVLTYDPLNSKDLEWRPITFEYFKYLMLAAIGVHIKDAASQEFAALPKVTGVLDDANERQQVSNGRQ